MGASSKDSKGLIKLYRQAKELLKCFDRPLTEDEFKQLAGLEYIVDYESVSEEGEKFFHQKLSQPERALLSERSKKYDSVATAEDCIDDLRFLKEEFPTKFISRNFYRENGKYSDSTWSKYFGNFTEFRQQAGLELTRQQKKIEKDIAKHASVDHYRKFFDTEVAPYYQKFEKEHLPSTFKIIMILSDLHDIECDEFTLEVFIAECERKQPDIIALNGDIYDLYEFSSYKQDPRHVKIKERFAFIHERLFRPLRRKCPNAQIDLFMGNHEYRLIKHLADATPNLRVLLSDVMGITFSKVFGLEEFEINWVSKFDLAAFTKKDVDDILKQNHKVYFDCYAVCHEPDETLIKAYSGTNGHHHRLTMISGFNPHTGPTNWVQTPAAHVPGAEYLAKISKWNCGFLEAIINTETKEVIQYPRQVHKMWAHIDGITYSRKI